MDYAGWTYMAADEANLRCVIKSKSKVFQRLLARFSVCYAGFPCSDNTKRLTGE